MYASQTKRLCVREASTDENRGQHRSASSVDAAPELAQHQQSTPAPTSSSSASRTPPIDLANPTPLPPTTRSSRRASLLLGTSSSANKRANTSCNSDINEVTMTASVSGNTASNENESPIKIVDANQTRQNHEPSTPSNMQYAVNANKNGDLSEDQLIQRLANETRQDVQIELILSIRNLITACNKKKTSLTSNPDFVKIIRMIDSDKQASSNVRTQLALLLCSVAKGGEQNVKVLNDSFVDDKLINLILSSHDYVLIEACLRCLRAIMSWPKVSRAWLLYDKYAGQNTTTTRQQSNANDKCVNGVEKIIEYASTSKSFVIQECIADIFGATCCRDKDQMILYHSGAIPCLVRLLESPSNRLTKAVLNWLVAMCLRNATISLEIVHSTCPSGVPVLDLLSKLMGKNEIQEIQFLAAKSYSLIYKALAPKHMKDDVRLTTHVLPTLIRMVHKDKPSQLRADAAECIAALIENDLKLQSTASNCDHLINSLANMLENDSLTLCDIRDYTSQLMNYRYTHEINWNAPILAQRSCPAQVLDLRNLDPNLTMAIPGGDTNKHESAQEMRRTAFLALAALASNLEVIRKKIFETNTVVTHLVRGLTETDPPTLKSVLTCLLSLSRSVQQLRTCFADNSVYNSLKTLLSTSSNEILTLVLSVLCNISLDFSPGKQHFLDSSTISILCNLTRSADPYLRLYGMWILMNMVYQLQDPSLKFQILETLGPAHVLSILETGTDEMLVLKTLGFLRNLLSPRSHIDELMKNYGKSIMRAIQICLERTCSSGIKEQALCVLTNIADGNVAKTYIMENRIILDHLARAICDEEGGDVRLAAICCITNLAHKEQDGFQLRQNELRPYGIADKLKMLLNTNDPILSDRVRTAYNQFLLGMNDKFVN